MFQMCCCTPEHDPQNQKNHLANYDTYSSNTPPEYKKFSRVCIMYIHITNLKTFLKKIAASALESKSKNIRSRKYATIRTYIFFKYC